MKTGTLSRAHSRPALPALEIVIGTALLLAAAAGWAAEPASMPRQDDRAACARHSVEEDRRTCLREAAAARAEARQGRLNVQGADYERNALRRCEALPAQDQAACRARVRGEGHVSGSVEGGGIYRETRETVPAQD